MGITVHEVALKRRPDEARALLEPLLAGKTTLVLGPSGAGKSTLINLLVPLAKAQVGEISSALNSGRHTTTATQWYWLTPQRRAALIDSPGFQEFGLRQIDAQRLGSLMPDMRAHAGGCKFYNCTHLHEPGCGVREALLRGEISESRYRIYAEMLGELSSGVLNRRGARSADQLGQRQQRQQQHPQHHRAPHQTDHAAQVAELRRQACGRAFG